MVRAPEHWRYRHVIVTTYFTAEYSVKRFAIVLGLALLSLGAALGVLAVVEPKEPRSFLGFFFTFVFVAGGTYLLYAAARMKNTTLAMTSDGLSYGPQFYSWDDITELGVMAGGKELYCSTRLARFAVELPLSKKLSPQQVKDLFQLLHREVVTLHTHIRLCDDNEKSNRIP